jgi:hypothetical protein
MNHHHYHHHPLAASKDGIADKFGVALILSLASLIISLLL